MGYKRKHLISINPTLWLKGDERLIRPIKALCHRLAHSNVAQISFNRTVPKRFTLVPSVFFGVQFSHRYGHNYLSLGYYSFCAHSINCGDCFGKSCSKTNENIENVISQVRAEVAAKV